MKIGIVGDIHWSRYSSILRQRGDRYSVRLENCIDSINWAENLTGACAITVYLGDFFDSSELNSEELTALNEINWSDTSHAFLVGNHEMGLNDLSYSSAHLFDFTDMYTNGVVDKPHQFKVDNVSLRYLPYILEDNRLPLSEYFYDDGAEKVIIFSHNDIAGIQMGKFISPNGFTIEEIHNNCDLFINGHLHNGSKVDDKIINVGNLTGQNFSEDAFKYDHVAFIVDTDTLKIEVYENPWALNFYKIDAVEHVPNLYAIKQNAVITLKCNDSDAEYYKKQLNEMSNVLEARVIIQPTMQILNEEMTYETLTVDHLESFKTYILNNFENTKELMEEMNEVLK